VRASLTPARSAGVLLVVAAGALVWVVLAFDSVPIRWDPSIGNSCRAVDPGTRDDLLDAAVVPLALLVVCLVGLSVVSGRALQRALTDRSEARPAQVAVGVSAVIGGYLVLAGYGIGDVFAIGFVLIVMGIALAAVVALLGITRARAGGWDALGRPFWLAVLQLVVVPAVVMATTYTDEIPLC